MDQQINDCHVHVGDIPEINRGLNAEDIYKHLHVNDLDKVIVIDENIERLKRLTDNDDDIYGLQWITERDTHKDLQLSRKIVGCKFHGAYGSYPRPSIDVLEYLQDHKSILLMHTGRFKDGNISSNTSYLHSIDIAKEYPNIKVILAHMGGTDTTICRHAIDESVSLPNVYFDTSGITTSYIIEYALEKKNPKYILFGSDVPWCSFKAMYYILKEANIPDQAKIDIFHDNLEELLK